MQEKMPPAPLLPKPEENRPKMPAKPDSLRSHQQAVSNWNSAHGSGCAVTVEQYDGELISTRTRTLAMLLDASRGPAIVFVDGCAEPYALSRVRAKGEAKPGV